MATVADIRKEVREMICVYGDVEQLSTIKNLIFCALCTSNDNFIYCLFFFNFQMINISVHIMRSLLLCILNVCFKCFFSSNQLDFCLRISKYHPTERHYLSDLFVENVIQGNAISIWKLW